MRSGGVAGLTAQTKLLPAIHVITLFDRYLREVSVYGLHVAPVGQDHDKAITAHFPGEFHIAFLHSEDGSPQRRRQIYAFMHVRMDAAETYPIWRRHCSVDRP